MGAGYPLDDTTVARVVEAFNRLGSITAAAREVGISKTSAHRYVHKAGIAQDLKTGTPPAGTIDMRPAATIRVNAPGARKCPLPPPGHVRRYIVSSAQNNTPAHGGFWQNLEAYARFSNAEILISQFTYDVGRYAAGTVKPGQEKHREPFGYCPEIEGHVSNHRVELAPGLIFCGEMNIQPSAERPLSGLVTYTGPHSCIIPHAKVAMEPAPRAKWADPKHLYSTGAVTLRNYIAKKAGQKAEFHHAYGALMVEVDSDGEWFVRQLNATDAGQFHDLIYKVDNGEVSRESVSAIVWGDVHEASLEPIIVQACWGADGMLEVLDPDFQFVHDVLDFRNRNHHDLDDPHKMFEKWVNGAESVRAELRDCARFLEFISRPDVRTVVVASNHDEAFVKWLKKADYRRDHANAIFFLEAELAWRKAIMARERGFSPVEWALRGEGAPEATEFLARDAEFLVNGIDCGSHGDLGANGFRGSPEQLRRSGRKRVVGHSHSAGIWGGLYVVGVTGNLDQVYNRGDSSWSRTHCVIYRNGKRALVTMRGPKWRAKGR